MKNIMSFFILLTMLASFVISFDMKYDWVGFTFLIMILQSLGVLAITCSGGVKLISVFFVFNIVFLNIIPWLHYSSGAFIWRSSAIHSETYLIINTLLFVTNFIVAGAYYCTYRKNYFNYFNFYSIKKESTSLYLLLFFSLSGVFGVVYLNNFSLEQILFRGLVEGNKELIIESSSFSLIAEMISRLTPVFSFFYAFTQVKGFFVKKSLLFLLMIIAVFPTGVPRYMVAFVYIPVSLLFFPVLRSSFLFVIGLIFSLIFIFPFLDQFRYFSNFVDLKLLPTHEFFYSGHFDAYENFATAFDSGLITYGYQLLGVILFFVPRSIWPEKPVGSGHEMAMNSGYFFNNISMPFLAEGYVNFGVVGVLFFAILIGVVMGKIDKIFYVKWSSNININYYSAIYYFLISAIFFLLRGDLLSSFSFIFSGVFVSFIIGKTLNLIRK